MFAYLSYKPAGANLLLLPDSAPLKDHVQTAWQSLPPLKGMWENLLSEVERAIESLEGNAATPVAIAESRP
jgi:hypothetical protein